MKICWNDIFAWDIIQGYPIHITKFKKSSYATVYERMVNVYEECFKDKILLGPMI